MMRVTILYHKLIITAGISASSANALKCSKFLFSPSKALGSYSKL